MIFRSFAQLLFAALVFCGSGNSQAHTRSESYTVWEITGPTVRTTFTLPDTEAARLSPEVAPEGSGGPSNEQLGGYLAAHLSVTSAGKDCARSGTPRPVAATPGYRRFELVFRCADPNSMTLHSSAFFEIVPSHITFARVRKGDAPVIEQLITTDHRELELSAGATTDQLQDASFFEYIWLGILHILTGPDHIAFVLGFVLISRRLRDLVYVITGFTLGHSVTLALAVTGIVRPHTAYIDVLIALTIALIGAENIAEATRRPAAVAIGAGTLLLAMAGASVAGYGTLPTILLLGASIFAACFLMLSGELRDATKLRLVITLIFGLIHGFAFANDLIEMNLPTGRMAELLFGFNVGVEMGQLSIVGLILAFVALLIRLRAALPRPIVVDVTSSALAGLGVFWMVSRTYSTGLG
jgi:hypothetical protein